VTVLREFYVALGGSKWFNNSLWSSDDCCRFFGLTCTFAGRVHALYLPSNNLVGTIPPSIARLTDLSALTLSDNSVAAQLPDAFANMTAFDAIAVARNRLTGTLPPSLFASRTVRLIDLSANALRGPIPPVRAPLLTALDLHFNRLNGSLFLNASMAPSLSVLDLANNFLTGQIPPSLGALPSLRILDLSANLFVGTPPPALGTLVDPPGATFGSINLGGGGSCSSGFYVVWYLQGYAPPPNSTEVGLRTSVAHRCYRSQTPYGRVV
jgi:hypothetical protein